MVVVGGATRLTDSGLSITEWKPILGIIPPLKHADWQDAFVKYKEIPEYKLVNKGMSLSEFKFIFWWEWAHRFLGRMIGFAFALPFIFFAWRGMISRRMVPAFAGLFALGGLQGFIGWYMVSSGLSERVDVSHYRLALHLSMAVFLFGAVLWTALRLAPEDRRDARFNTITSAQRWGARLLVVLLFGQIILGAFVAGLKAGLASSTWPLMNGQVIPEGMWALGPWYLNLVENPLTVQFDHRLLAYVIAALALLHGIAVMRSADDERIARSAGWLLLGVLVQIALGVCTILAHVPLWLALGHQAAAVVLFGTAVWHLHNMQRAERAR